MRHPRPRAGNGDSRLEDAPWAGHEGVARGWKRGQREMRQKRARKRLSCVGLRRPATKRHGRGEVGTGQEDLSLEGQARGCRRAPRSTSTSSNARCWEPFPPRPRHG